MFSATRDPHHERAVGGVVTMVSTQPDNVSNLIDALCGRLPTHVPVSLPGGAQQGYRGRVGVLNEIVRERVVDFGNDVNEQTHTHQIRLTEALMNVMHSDRTSLPSGRAAETPSAVHFKESLGMLTPLIVEYDDITQRQFDRISEQELELEQMREGLRSAKAHVQAMMEATSDLKNQQGTSGHTSTSSDTNELQQRIVTYATDNELLRELINTTAIEVKNLNAELNQRSSRCQNLERDVSRLKLEKASGVFVGPKQHGRDTNSEWATRVDPNTTDGAETDRRANRLERTLFDLKRFADSQNAELRAAQEYVSTLEGTLRSYQTQSLEVYKQVNASLQATERATVQRDQSFTREKALTDEVAELRCRLEKNSAKIDGHAMRISRRRNAAMGDDLKSTKFALDNSLRENVRLNGNLANAKEEIARLAKAQSVVVPEVGAGSDETGDDEKFGALVSITNFGKDVSADEQRLASRQKASDDSVKQRLRHAEESLLKQQAITTEMEASASHAISILREKLRRARKNELRR
jgi:predicted  nucleic acid-binding Zn-ribbon protein